MSERSARPWLNYALGLLCLCAIVAAILVVGPASGSGADTRRTAKAVAGVVQATVSGSGNLEPESQLGLGFKTAGTVAHVYVKQGEYVTQGRLIAALDPVPAEVTLEQSRANLRTAEATLAKAEETGGESGGSNASGGAGGGAGSGKSAAAGSNEGDVQAQSAQSQTSPATREADIASARAAVDSARLTVRADEEALADTKLYAPQDGTIVTLSGQVGEVVSATGTTRSSSAGSNTGSGSGGGSGAGSGRSGTGSSGSGAGTGSSGNGGSGSGSSAQAFALLSDLSSMKLVAALSESEIHEVKVGQIATVTVEALEGRKLAAHVSEVATLSSSSSGVVSYDVVFALDQMDPGLKPGMSATAEVVVKQEAGVSVPSSAISGGAVTVLRGGHETRQQVSTGLVGDSSTIVLGGLRAGETVALPQATSGGSSSSLTSLLRSRLGGGSGGGSGALGGGGGTFIGGGGGGAFFRAGGG